MKSFIVFIISLVIVASFAVVTYDCLINEDIMPLLSIIILFFGIATISNIRRRLSNYKRNIS